MEIMTQDPDTNTGTVGSTETIAVPAVIGLWRYADVQPGRDAPDPDGTGLVLVSPPLAGTEYVWASVIWDEVALFRSDELGVVPEDAWSAPLAALPAPAGVAEALASLGYAREKGTAAAVETLADKLGYRIE